MAGARKLVIEILGNAKDAAKAFGDVRSDSQKTEERLSNFGTAALGVGVAIAGGLAYAVTQFVEADVASQKLDNSARNAAASARINASALRDVAQATQSKTAADGDALVAGQAMLVQFGATQDQTVALTPLLADLSRKMGVDTETAARAVGKALNGSTGQLQRMGIQVDATKAATDPFTATMEALSSTVGGFAEAEGATAAGTLERIKNQLGDVVEAVGGGALEAFAPLVDAMSGMVVAGGPAGDALGNIGGKLGVISSVTLLAMGGLIKAREGIDKIREASTSAAGGVGRMGFALGALGAVGGALAIVGIVQSINEATRSTEAFEAALIDLKNATTIESEIDALIAAASSMEGLGDKVWDLLMTGSVKMGTLAVDLQGTSVQVDNLGRALEATAASGDMSLLARQLQLLKGPNGAEGTSAAMDALRAAMAPYEQQVANAAAATSGHTDALQADAEAALLAVGALDEYADALKAQTDPIFGAMRAIQQSNDAKKKAADAQAKVTSLEKAGVRGSDEYADALRELARANLDSTSSAVGQQSALAGLASQMRSGAISGAQFSQTLDDLVASGLISADTAASMRNQFGLTAGAADIAAAKVTGFTGAANAIPPGKTTTVTANTADAQAKVADINTRINNLRGVPRPAVAEIQALVAKGDIDAAERKLQNLERSRRTTLYVDVPNQNFITRFLGFSPRATGGTVQAGKPYLVGERGPEIVVPGSGYVVPTRRLIDAPAGGSGGGDGGVIVNVTAGVGDPVAIGRTVVEALKAYERTSGTAWRN